MRSEFAIDGVMYVIEFTGRNEFTFCVDAANSDRTVYQMSRFERGFWDEPPETVWTTTGAGRVFEVKRNVETFVGAAIKHHRPYYFSYHANEAVKISLYHTFAERLCKRHGYRLTVTDEGTVFRFTRRTPGGAAKPPHTSG